MTVARRRYYGLLMVPSLSHVTTHFTIAVRLDRPRTTFCNAYCSLCSSRAAKGGHGHEAVVKLLLEKRVDMKSKNDRKGRA